VPLLAQLGADQSSDLLVFLNIEDLCGHRGEMTGKEAAIEVKTGTWPAEPLKGKRALPPIKWRPKTGIPAGQVSLTRRDRRAVRFRRRVPAGGGNASDAAGGPERAP
jgi:hypothetical protein